MPDIRRILVPTDFSDRSDAALAYAIDLAKRLGSSIHVLHVIDDASFTAVYPDAISVELAGVRAQLTDEAKRRLDALADRCTARGVPATSEVIVGRPARAISETAAARGSDLIVMATHGRSGLAHLMLGSVAERVLRTAPCAVLTVRAGAAAETPQETQDRVAAGTPRT